MTTRRRTHILPRPAALILLALAVVTALALTQGHAGAQGDGVPAWGQVPSANTRTTPSWTSKLSVLPMRGQRVAGVINRVTRTTSHRCFSTGTGASGPSPTFQAGCLLANSTAWTRLPPVMYGRWVTGILEALVDRKDTTRHRLRRF
jgi:hypothetical protein